MRTDYPAIHAWAGLAVLGGLAFATYVGLTTFTLWHLLIILMFGIVNFVPTFIARRRKHQNGVAILVLNLAIFALWWTYLVGTVMSWGIGKLLNENATVTVLFIVGGWILGLVWSFTKRGTGAAS
jgi:hypothetical protein